jgi:hypothetical protein
VGRGGLVGDELVDHGPFGDARAVVELGFEVKPHLHVLFLDGVYRELSASTVGFTALPHLSTREVGEVLEGIVRMKRPAPQRVP